MTSCSVLSKALIRREKQNADGGLKTPHLHPGDLPLGNIHFRALGYNILRNSVSSEIKLNFMLSIQSFHL